MKKILLSLFAISVVSVVAIGATTAYFSDKEESTGNTFTAGTIDLEMNDENPSESAIFTFENMKPSEEMAPVVIKLKNVGQNNGYLYQKIDYIDKDNVPTGSEFVGDMSADKFAALIYVESISYQHFGTDGYVGNPRDDIAGLLYIDENFGNNDGKCSLYEMKEFGWMPYSDVYPEDANNSEHTLQVGHTATYTFVFHMGDSLKGWALNGAILSDVEDNRPQADGIELTWTAVLMQNPGMPTP